GAADAVLAADVGAGQREVVAQEIRQQAPWLDERVVRLAIHIHANLDLLGHAAAPRWTRAAAARRARRLITTAILRRYSAEPCTSEVGSTSLTTSSAAASKFSVLPAAPSSTRSAAVALMGVGATPHRLSRTPVQRPFASSASTAAAPQMAKSP